MGEMAEEALLHADMAEAGLIRIKDEERKLKSGHYWRTKDGRTLLIKKMTDSHLANTVAYFRKRANALKLKEMSALDKYMETAPDGAYFAALDEHSQLSEMEDDDYLIMYIPGFKGVLREAIKRKVLSKERNFLMEP